MIRSIWILLLFTSYWSDESSASGIIEYRISGQVDESTVYEYQKHIWGFMPTIGEPFDIVFFIDADAEPIILDDNSAQFDAISYIEVQFSKNAIVPKYDHLILYTPLAVTVINDADWNGYIQDIFRFGGLFKIHPHNSTEWTHQYEYFMFISYPAQFLWFPHDTVDSASLPRSLPTNAFHHSFSVKIDSNVGYFGKVVSHSARYSAIYHFDPCDVNEDYGVDLQDAVQIIEAWGPCDDCCEDISQNGMVDVEDLLRVITEIEP